MSLNCSINHLKNIVLLISTGINNLNIFKIMAKKVKYYGVFVKVIAKDEIPEEVKELVGMLSGHGKVVTPNKSVMKVFVFDNESEQIECALNVNGSVIETIDAVDKEEFMKKAKELKEKYSDKEEATGDSCLKPD